MGEFYNFARVELIRIGAGQARILQVAEQAVEYVDAGGVQRSVDLQECARTYLRCTNPGISRQRTIPIGLRSRPHILHPRAGPCPIAASGYALWWMIRPGSSF
jgi:hypothetical protein